MAGILKLFYSSGTSLTNIFGKDPSESTGGIITDVELVSGFNNLFRTISNKALSEGSIEYRIVFLKNVGDLTLTNLEFFLKVPAITTETDPSELTPADGDEFVVTTGAIGLWKDKDRMTATYVSSTSTWTFTFPHFSKYEFGFVTPVDITLNDTVLTGSYIDTLETVFEQPFGVTFLEADDVSGSVKVSLPDLDSEEILAMVVKRIVPKQRLLDIWYSCPDDNSNNETTRNPGEETIIVDEQSESITFSYDDGA